MEKEKPKEWYLYHKVGDKIVLDRALHTTHHKQALSAMGHKPPRYVAATLVPLTDEEVARYEAFHSAKLDKSHKRELPAFEEPASWKSFRARQESRRRMIEGAK